MELNKRCGKESFLTIYFLFLDGIRIALHKSQFNNNPSLSHPGPPLPSSRLSSDWLPLVNEKSENDRK